MPNNYETLTHSKTMSMCPFLIIVILTVLLIKYVSIIYWTLTKQCFKAIYVPELKFDIPSVEIELIPDQIRIHAQIRSLLSSANEFAFLSTLELIIDELPSWRNMCLDLSAKDGFDFYVMTAIQPFHYNSNVSNCTSNTHQIHVTMHGPWRPSFISKVIGVQIESLRAFDWHSRFLVTDNSIIIGGVDYSKKLLVPEFHQQAGYFKLKDGKLKEDIHKFVRHEFSDPGQNPIPFPFVGTNKTTSTVYDTLLYQIENSAKSIIIENQFFQSTAETKNQILCLLRKVAVSKPHIVISILTNGNYELNPGLPCKDSLIKPICLMFVKSLNDARGLDDLRNVEVFEFEDIFTHNKIFIFDCEIVVIGSFNVAEESMHADGNYELGMVAKSPKFATSYCEWWMDRNVTIKGCTACSF